MRQFDLLWEGCRDAFSSERGWLRAKRLALSGLACLGRHTVTGLLCAGNRQAHDWSAEYRLFTRKRFSPAPLFAVARRAVAALIPAGVPLVVSMDDSLLRKTGRKVLRANMDKDDPAARRALWALVDGSYTNKHVLRNVPDNTLVIGRIRGDAKLLYPPVEGSAGAKGRTRWYGGRAPTPEELRKDESVAVEKKRQAAQGFDRLAHQPTPL